MEWLRINLELVQLHSTYNIHSLNEVGWIWWAGYIAKMPEINPANIIFASSVRVHVKRNVHDRKTNDLTSTVVPKPIGNA